MYDDDWSGDTEMISMRGSGKTVGSSERAFVADDGLVTRFMSEGSSGLNQRSQSKTNSIRIS